MLLFKMCHTSEYSSLWTTKCFGENESELTIQLWLKIVKMVDIPRDLYDKYFDKVGPNLRPSFKYFFPQYFSNMISSSFVYNTFDHCMFSVKS